MPASTSVCWRHCQIPDSTGCCRSKPSSTRLIPNAFSWSSSTGSRPADACSCRCPASAGTAFISIPIIGARGTTGASAPSSNPISARLRSGGRGALASMRMRSTTPAISRRCKRWTQTGTRTISCCCPNRAKPRTAPGSSSSAATPAATCCRPRPSCARSATGFRTTPWWCRPTSTKSSPETPMSICSWRLHQASGRAPTIWSSTSTKPTSAGQSSTSFPPTPKPPGWRYPTRRWNCTWIAATTRRSAVCWSNPVTPGRP
ncbi:hypothetical protein GALL_495700 [mine drainage metagenome]|uniref:Uncharacterized protein n=1 Tax=mine drainage metagenome TaxID=410659 RepID=A0A1J5PDI8_9ZZZZ